MERLIVCTSENESESENSYISDSSSSACSEDVKGNNYKKHNKCKTSKSKKKSGIFDRPSCIQFFLCLSTHTIQNNMQFSLVV
jgi:hypothetical protein